MANSVAVLDKIARNLDMLGLTSSYVRNASDITLANGGNALVVTYVAASIQSPMGGIDGATTPFLGIGVGNPGVIKIKSGVTTNDAITDVIGTDLAGKLFAVCAAFANDVLLENSDAAWSLRIRGSVDMIGVGA